MTRRREGPGGAAAGTPAAHLPSEARGALRFVVLVGVVSLFADMTYEGARSITGPYLLSLGAAAAVVGTVGGLGEFLGYGLRLLSGHLADRSRRYWLLTGLGYALNLLAVPALALAPGWPAAAGLVLLERIGKAVRTPARDVMLSLATRHVGRGLGFGLHEALDQVGAVAGPLLVAAWLAGERGYRGAFALLALPALAALATLAAARQAFPDPGRLAGTAPASRDGGAAPAAQPAAPWRADRQLALYLAFVTLAVAGFAHFQLIAYHIKARGLLPDPAIPAAFALAMGVDAAAALLMGIGYDRMGLRTTAALPALTAASTALAFAGSPAAAWAGIALWGAALGVQESVMRAAVADLCPVHVRGTAYGTFNAASAAGWFAGSVAMGLLYGRGPAAVVGFSLAAELVAAVALATLLRRRGG